MSARCARSLNERSSLFRSVLISSPRDNAFMVLAYFSLSTCQATWLVGERGYFLLPSRSTQPKGAFSPCPHPAHVIHWRQ